MFVRKWVKRLCKCQFSQRLEEWCSAFEDEASQLKFMNICRCIWDSQMHWLGVVDTIREHEKRIMSRIKNIPPRVKASLIHHWQCTSSNLWQLGRVSAANDNLMHLICSGMLHMQLILNCIARSVYFTALCWSTALQNGAPLFH